MAKEKAETKTTAAKTATTKTSAAKTTAAPAPAAKKTTETKAAPKAETKKAAAPVAKTTEVKPAAKAETKKAEAPKAEVKKTAAPAKAAEAKTAPKTEAKKAEPKAEAKKAEAPKAEAKVEAKKAEAPAPATDEKAAVAYTGRFVIKRTDKGNFVFKLFSSNGKTVAIGTEPYSEIASCKTGIKSVVKNASTAPIEDQTLQKVVEQKCPKWIVFQDKKGEFRLRLIASNGNSVAATNDGYTTKAAAKNGIDVIARAAKNAEVIRNDHLW